MLAACVILVRFGSLFPEEEKNVEQIYSAIGEDIMR